MTLAMMWARADAGVIRWGGSLGLRGSTLSSGDCWCWSILAAGWLEDERVPQQIFSGRPVEREADLLSFAVADAMSVAGSRGLRRLLSPALAVGWW